MQVKGSTEESMMAVKNFFAISHFQNDGAVIECSVLVLVQIQCGDFNRLQLRCTRGQRRTEQILRSKVKGMKVMGSEVRVTDNFTGEVIPVDSSLSRTIWLYYLLHIVTACLTLLEILWKFAKSPGNFLAEFVCLLLL